MNALRLIAVSLSLPLAAQTALVEEGDNLAGLGNVTSIANLAVNDAGEWIVEVDTDNADTNADAALVKNGALLLVEGGALPAPLGATVDTFDTVNLNNASASCWNLFLDGTAGSSDDSGIYFGDALLIQESAASTASAFTPGTPYIGFFETKINDANDTLVMASVDDVAIASSVDRALVILDLDGSGTLLSETVIAKEGDLLAGQSETVADFETGPHNFAFNDLGDVLFIADLNGDTAVDHAVYLNDTILAQEGSPSPVAGRNWFSLSGAEVDLSDNCEYVISGSLEGDAASNLLIEKNGAKFVQEGDVLAAVAPAPLTSFGSGPVLIANSGNVLWYATFATGDTNTDSGLFVDDTLLVQEGVSTVGGVVIDTLRGIQDGYTISPNGRYVVFEAVLLDGTEGAYLIDRGQVAHQELRNGSGINVVCLKGLTPPAIGTAWMTQIDSTHHAGATFVALFAHGQPLAGLPLAIGELLVDVGSPQVLLLAAVATGVDVLSANVPNDVSVIGASIHGQGIILGGAGTELCNAIQPTAGI